jgi:hypothetical protein
MVTEIKETIENARNRLITECHKEPEAQRSGYINGVLDMYNEARKIKDEEEI